LRSLFGSDLPHSMASDEHRPLVNSVPEAAENPNEATHTVQRAAQTLVGARENLATPGNPDSLMEENDERKDSKDKGGFHHLHDVVDNNGELHAVHDPKTNLSGMFDFANTEAMKERVRKAKLQPDPYNVFDFYHETGFFQWLAKHPYFENTTLSVIVLNALWLSFDTDGNTADTILEADAIYIVADTFFFSYFSLELFSRFMAFKCKRNCFRDGWFVFDTCLVALYAFDPFSIGLLAALSGGGGLDLPTAILRLFRLARLSRLVRMLRSLPELMIMIKGMMSASQSVAYTLFLQMVITYIFAIALRNLAPPDSNIEEVYFSSVPETMHNLLVFGTFLDNLSDYILDVKAESPPCLILSWMYIALASLTVMNMLIGVLCEVISAVAEEEKESLIVDKVNEKFSSIVQYLDTDGSGLISWDEFQQILDPAWMYGKEALRALESVNVDAELMVDMAEDFFFEDGEKVEATFPEFMEMVLDLRGGQPATVEWVLKLAKRFNKKFLKLKSRMDGFESKINGMKEKIEALLDRKRKRIGAGSCPSAESF